VAFERRNKLTMHRWIESNRIEQCLSEIAQLYTRQLLLQFYYQ